MDGVGVSVDECILGALALVAKHRLHKDFPNEHLKTKESQPFLLCCLL